MREEVVSSVLLGVREEIVYRDAPHLKRSEMFDELKLKDAYARLRLRPTKTRNSKKFEQLLPCSF